MVRKGDGVIRSCSRKMKKQKRDLPARPLWRRGEKRILVLDVNVFLDFCGVLAIFIVMSSRRIVRVNEAVRMELANLIQRERALEGLIITISSVDVTPDLKNAHIYLSILEQRLSSEAILTILNKKRYDWQSWIARRLQLKYTPKLFFQFDQSLERGDRVMQILNELDEQNKG